MKALKESYDSIKPLIDNSIVINALESLRELIIAVESDEGGGHLLPVHKCLERYVSVLLELHVVLEALFDHSIHLGLEDEEL